jgi:hypothetical protein
VTFEYLDRLQRMRSDEARSRRRLARSGLKAVAGP